MKKVVYIAIVVACLVFVAWRVFEMLSGGQGMGQGGPGVVVPVEVSPVEQRTVHDIGEFSGTLLPKSSFNVAPKVTGRLEKLLVNIGDSVKNGDLIAVLDSEEYNQAVAQANAELEVSHANLVDAKSSLDIADREYKRAQELQKQGIASATELDSALSRFSAAQSKCQVAEAQVKQADAALKAAEVRLSYTQIRASWEDGKGLRKVAERFVDEGAMLRANDSIVSIVDLSSVRAVINVVEEDFPNIRIGQPTTITTDAYGDKVFTGTVIRRAPILQEESRQSRVEIEIPNPEGLLAPGMFVRATIQFAVHDKATVVPQAALIRRNGGQGVFQANLKEMKAKFVPIQVGVTEGEWVEVLQPKLEGMVVTLGQHLLEDGSAITVASPETGDQQNSSGQPSQEGSR
jgi:RND family efflux transporter MFP subunit